MERIIWTQQELQALAKVVARERVIQFRETILTLVNTCQVPLIEHERRRRIYTIAQVEESLMPLIGKELRLLLDGHIQAAEPVEVYIPVEVPVEAPVNAEALGEEMILMLAARVSYRMQLRALKIESELPKGKAPVISLTPDKHVVMGAVPSRQRKVLIVGLDAQQFAHVREVGAAEQWRLELSLLPRGEETRKKAVAPVDFAIVSRLTDHGGAAAAAAAAENGDGKQRVFHTNSVSSTINKCRDLNSRQ